MKTKETLRYMGLIVLMTFVFYIILFVVLGFIGFVELSIGKEIL
jgi:preprotein translocase subunit SecE